MKRITIIIITFIILFGCVYYNTFFNAKKYFVDAENAKEKNKGKLNKTIIIKYDNVIERCARVINDYPNSKYVDDAVLLMGKAFFGKEEYYKSAQKFKEFIKFYPDSKSIPEAKLLLAKTYLKQKKFDEAKTVLNNIITDNSLKSIHFDAHYLFAQYYYEQKEYVLAIQNLKTILIKKNRKNKLYFQAFFQLGKIYFENNQFDESLKTFQDLLSAKPRKRVQLDAEFFIGKIYLATGQNDKALTSFKNLRNKETDEDNIYNISIQIGICYMKQEDLEQASKEFNNIIANNKKNKFSAEAYYYLGEMYFTYVHDYKKAIDNFDKVHNEYRKSQYVEEALRKGAIASKIVQYKEKDKTTDVVAIVDIQFQLAEYYTLDLNMPDSALYLYDEICKQYNYIQTELDSINLLIDKLIANKNVIIDTTEKISVDSTNDSIKVITKMDTASLNQQRKSLNNLLITYRTDILPKSLFMKSWIWLKVKNDTVKADSIVQELRTKFPDSEYSYAGEQLLAGKKPQFITKQNLEAGIYFGKVETYFLKPDSLGIEEVISYLDTIIQYYSKSDYYPKALYTKGYLLLTEQNDTLTSKIYFKKLQDNFAKNELAIKTQKFFNGQNYLFPKQEEIEEKSAIPDSLDRVMPVVSKEDTLLKIIGTPLPDTIETKKDSTNHAKSK